MKRLVVLLITLALIAGMVGCAATDSGDHHPDPPARYNLIVVSTAGGSVVTPGQGTFEYDAGAVVELLAVAEARHTFAGWGGSVDAGVDTEEASTTITMNDHYIVMASFVMEIRNWHDLHAIRDTLASHCLLMNDLDSATAGYAELASQTANNGEGWEPIGASDHPFVGRFDGQGHEIRNMWISRPNQTNVSLFGYVDGGAVEDVSVTDSDVTGGWHVGGLVGYNSGTVYNSYARVRVAGDYWVGGLVGLNVGTVSYSSSSGGVYGYHQVGGLVGMNSGAVSNSHSAAAVTGAQNVGGLMGGIVGAGAVIKCYATGSVIGERWVGGLLGANSGTVRTSYSSSGVTGEFCVGGLVGVSYGAVTSSYSTGSVSGVSQVGGLMGLNGSHVSGSEAVFSGDVSDCYSTSNVTGQQFVGGLLGRNYDGAVIRSYSAGSVLGDVDSGGLVGQNEDIVSDSFWDTETSKMKESDGGTGRTTAQMMSIAAFSGAGWSIVGVADPGARNASHIWNIVDGQTYPFLSWQP